MSQLPTPEQIRDTMPFAALTGAELLQASPELVVGRMEWAVERCTAGGLWLRRRGAGMYSSVTAHAGVR
jgi:hypothetical protein